MIKHLKTPNLKALRESTLYDLGKINVICGRNNSGKTTLLEAIHSRQMNVGKALDETSLNQLYDDSVGTLNRYTAMGPETIQEKFRRVLREIADRQVIWFCG